MKKYNTNLFGQKLNVSQAIDSNAEGKGTILGCVPVFVAVAIGVLFNYLSM